MRIRINLDEQLLADATRLALESNLTVSAVVEEALRERLARRQERKSVRLTVFGSGGLLPGASLDDTVVLLDTMHDTDRHL